MDRLVGRIVRDKTARPVKFGRARPSRIAEKALQMAVTQRQAHHD
jgi:hypothetical protein